MAYTESIVDLDVINTYNDLMKASTAQGSVYLHAKETLEELMNNSDMTASEKAAVVSQTIGSIATQMTNSALSAAIQIEQDNRDAPYQLAKLRAETELTQAQTDKMNNDAIASAANIDKIRADIDATRIGGWKVQADIYTKNGINVDGQNLGNAILSTSTLPKFSNAGDLVSSEQARANMYSILASASRKDGNVTITTDANGGVLSLTPTTPLEDTLTGSQIKVAIRQEKGFDDNKVQHAANSSSSMIGMLLSTENTSALNDSDVALWRSAVTELATPYSSTTISKTLTITSVHSSVSKAADLIVTGTSTGITYGSNIEIYVLNTVNSSVSTIDVGIVEEDTTWSLTLTSTQLDTVSTGAGEIVVGLGSVFATVKATLVTEIIA